VELFSPAERAGYDPALLYDPRCFPKAALFLLDRFRLTWLRSQVTLLRPHIMLVAQLGVEPRTEGYEPTMIPFQAPRFKYV
jgi:hypothetical protein